MNSEYQQIPTKSQQMPQTLSTSGANLLMKAHVVYQAPAAKKHIKSSFS